MIFAKKLVILRKQKGWSQEDLADKINVSRQSVSKWEGTHSIPDFDKMLRLSELFEVSLDTLMKDEINIEDQSDQTEDLSAIRRVTIEEANSFIKIKASTAWLIAFAVLLCILSPIALMILSRIKKLNMYGISEELAVGIGIMIMIILVTIAVAIFIFTGDKTAAHSFIEKEVFETEYGVDEMVKLHRENYSSSYTKSKIIGTCMCILAGIPFFVGASISEGDDLFMIMMICTGIAMFGIAVVFFVQSGIRWSCYDKLLQEGEYTKQKKEFYSSVGYTISSVYWIIVWAIYVGVSFMMDNWDISWLIMAISAILYPVLLLVVKLFKKS